MTWADMDGSWGIMIDWEVGEMDGGLVIWVGAVWMGLVDMDWVGDMAVVRDMCGKQYGGEGYGLGWTY